jgi:hypothetical protein
VFVRRLLQLAGGQDELTQDGRDHRHHDQPPVRPGGGGSMTQDVTIRRAAVRASKVWRDDANYRRATGRSRGSVAHAPI